MRDNSVAFNVIFILPSAGRNDGFKEYQPRDELLYTKFCRGRLHSRNVIARRPFCGEDGIDGYVGNYPFVCQPGAHSAIGQICLYKRGSDSFNQSEGFAYIYAKTQLFFTLVPNIYICAFSQHPGLHIAFLEQSG